MKKVLKAPAKVNLCLKVNGKRGDGYHDLTMVMQAISIYDTIEIEITRDGEFDFFGFVKVQHYLMRPFRGLRNIDLNFLKQFARKEEDLKEERQINLKCNFNYIPTDERNLIVKVVKYIFEKYEIKDKIFIYLKKLIPTSAGLGGGSSDAAEVLLFLNKFYKLNLSIDELVEIALKFGSDIPFFLYKKICLCEGRGEKITMLPSYNNYFILIATPNIRVSTKDAYEDYDKYETSHELSTFENHKKEEKEYRKIINALNRKKLGELAHNIFNDLEYSTIQKYNDISVFKEKLVKYGALSSLMSGSGPTVFGIFNNYFKAKNCKDKLKKEHKDAFVFITKPI